MKIKILVSLLVIGIFTLVLIPCIVNAGVMTFWDSPLLAIPSGGCFHSYQSTFGTLEGSDYIYTLHLPDYYNEIEILIESINIKYSDPRNVDVNIVFSFKNIPSELDNTYNFIFFQANKNQFVKSEPTLEIVDEGVEKYGTIHSFLLVFLPNDERGYACSNNYFAGVGYAYSWKPNMHKRYIFKFTITNNNPAQDEFNDEFIFLFPFPHVELQSTDTSIELPGEYTNLKRSQISWIDYHREYTHLNKFFDYKPVKAESYLLKGSDILSIDSPYTLLISPVTDLRNDYAAVDFNISYEKTTYHFLKSLKISNLDYSNEVYIGDVKKITFNLTFDPDALKMVSATSNIEICMHGTNECTSPLTASTKSSEIRVSYLQEGEKPETLEIRQNGKIISDIVQFLDDESGNKYPIKIRVNLHFYQTWWFNHVLIPIVGIGVIAGLIKMYIWEKIKRGKKRKKSKK